ncbi:MAG: hypothetical protein HOY69_27735, partial [Streptomyces sp.]|nr:hypothetical protein [Streptomyces sp.]
GPQYQAPPLAAHDAAADDGKGGAGAGTGTPQQAAGARSSGGGLRAMDFVAAGTGGAVALAGLGAAALVHRRQSRTTRGGA